MTDAVDITADAMALQERDEFRSQGWLKVISPAKVNLHLAIGARRDDGYHDAATVLHALNLHDVAYIRRKQPDTDDSTKPFTRLVACGDVPVPEVSSESNLATKAAVVLADRLGREEAGLEIRIEKNIPAEAGLGGGSSNAAAVLVGAARLWGVDPRDPVIEEAARQIGSDVAFFLHGGCSYYEGAGDVFVRDLAPSKQAVALVKPDGGVSTAEAYRTFDSNPQKVPGDVANRVHSAQDAREIALYNNLAPAAEALMPALADIRGWLVAQPGVRDVLLCGSGASTFAVCDGFSEACAVVASARKRGLWARATSFGSVRAMAVDSDEGLGA